MDTIGTRFHSGESEDIFGAEIEQNSSVANCREENEYLVDEHNGSIFNMF